MPNAGRPSAMKRIFVAVSNSSYNKHLIYVNFTYYCEVWYYMFLFVNLFICYWILFTKRVQKALLNYYLSFFDGHSTEFLDISLCVSLFLMTTKSQKQLLLSIV